MDITKSSEHWSSKLFRVINSTICFCLAYIAITHLYYFTLAAIGRFFGFDCFVYYYGVKFMLNQHHWNRLNIGLIFSGGAMFYLLFGLLGIYLFDKTKKLKSIVNLFFVWMFVVGACMFCTQAVIAAIGLGEYNSPFYQGLAVVYAWVHIPSFVVYAMIIPFAVLYVYFIVNFAVPFLRMAYSYTRVNKLSRRRKFFAETAIVPFILGSVVVTYLTFPMNLFVHLTQMTAIFLALCGTWLAMTYVEVMKDDVLRYKNIQKFYPVIIVVLALVILWVKVTFRGVFVAA